MPIDVGVKPPIAEVYLGDGVYAKHDGYQIWLWTSDGVHSSSGIALEPNVIMALCSFVRKCGGEELLK